MATLKFNGSTFTVSHAVKGTDYVHGYNDNNECIVAIDGISDFSVIEYDGTYMAPDACLGEACNEVLCINGVLVRRDGAPLPAGASGSSSVKSYGAVGDGKTDDTAAFREALASSRVVHVPGGTYKLRSELIIRDNCCLELSQDTVLEFTQTGGACIALMMLANLKGNWATIKVPYEFSGDVVYAYSNDTLEAEQHKVPPFSRWDPQWKSGRYVSDINICKADSRGFHYAVEPGDCNGNAVYLSADNTQGMLNFMWGVHIDGLRIAGAFKHGVRAVNIDNGWMHEMRIDNAFIDACEIGVSLEDCNNTYISAVIQPRCAYSVDKVYKPYAKHGIQLIRSKNTDLSGSRVWDWFNTDPDKLVTLWTENGEYQPYAMIGNCSGAIINDYCYYENDAPDIRKRIFTDNDINLDTLTVLQEPITRWFKIKNNNPYYTDGLSDHKLITQEHLDAHFDTGVVKDFTDRLPMATDTDGSIYNGIGYKMNTKANSYGGGITDDPYHLLTGFIPCNKSSQINCANFTFAKGDDDCRIIMFDANFNYVMHVNRGNLLKGKTYYVEYTEKTDGFTLQINGVGELNNVVYFRLVVYKAAWGENPMIAVDEEVKYTIEGFLADGVKVKGENVIGTPGQETPDWVATKEESGGNVVVISEQTVTSGMWSKLQVDIQLGIAYEVYINGARYTCTAYEEDGGIYLGNPTLFYSSSTKPHNNEPFCIYMAVGATSGFFYKDSTLGYPLTLKVTDHITTTYNKMPKEYLPDDIGLEPLIGTTNNITPVQVADAIRAGRTIALEHTDETLGRITFNSFAFTADYFSAVEASATIMYNGVLVAVVLFGENGTWDFEAQQVLTPETMPEGGTGDILQYTVDELNAMQLSQLDEAVDGHNMFLLHRVVGGTCDTFIVNVSTNPNGSKQYSGWRVYAGGVENVNIYGATGTNNITISVSHDTFPCNIRNSSIENGSVPVWQNGSWMYAPQKATQPAIFQVSADQLVDGATISMDPYILEAQMAVYTETFSAVLIAMTSTSIAVAHVLSVTASEGGIPLIVTCVSPTTGSLITVTLTANV